MKRWIQVRIKVTVQELKRLKMEPWRAVDAHNGGAETHNGARKVCGTVVEDSHHLNEEQVPGLDPHLK
jgi:hypothetical protein